MKVLDDVDDYQSSIITPVRVVFVACTEETEYLIFNEINESNEHWWRRSVFPIKSSKIRKGRFGETGGSGCGLIMHKQLPFFLMQYCFLADPPVSLSKICLKLNVLLQSFTFLPQ